MSLKNYYVSYYHSIINKDVSKATIFYLLNNNEQKTYSDEYKEDNYSAIFASNDADDYIDELLKSDEHKEFRKQLLLEVKKLAENYYVSYYKAIMDEDHLKFIRLFKLNLNETLAYEREFLEISYDDIFQDNDPYDVLGEVFKEKINDNSDFYRNVAYNDAQIFYIFYDTFNSLANQDSIEIREKNKEDILKSPMLNYCPNPDLGLNVIDNLLSLTYSKAFNYNQVSSLLISLFNRSTILADLFSVISLSTPLVYKSSDSQLSIMLTAGNISDFDPTKHSSKGGEHNPITNTLIVNSNNKNQINSGFFAHEFYHRLMDSLYNKISSNPYKDEQAEVINKYHQAIRNVLLNIHDFIKQKFNFELSIDEGDNTWQIGKKLALLLFPENIHNDGLLFDHYVSILIGQDLGIDSRLPWLDHYSTLERFVFYKRFDLVDKLIQLGAKLPHYFLNYVLAFKDNDLIEWGFLNSKDIDLNFKDDKGKTALDYFADDKVMTKRLIDLGAEVYPANYDKICSANPEYKDDKDLPLEVTDYLKAIKWLLVLYIQSDNYLAESEDAEFIPRLPQIIAEDFYHGEVIDTLRPLEQFIVENVTPDCVEYIYQNDPTGICLPLTEYFL